MAAALLCLARPAPAAAAAACPSAGSEPATVAAATDGDSLTLRLADGAPVRLAGIDVPAWAAPAATAAVRRLLPPDGAVTLAAAAPGPDRYGRRHVFVFLPDGRQLAAAVIAEGAARARWLPQEWVCFGAFLAVEGRARHSRLGIWASPQAILTADDPSLVSRSGLYETVSGRLESVGHGNQITFLDFGRNYRRDFTVMLSASVAKALTGTVGSVDSLVGRQLLVRGVIENNHGAAIRLNDAAEIELSDDAPGP